VLLLPSSAMFVVCYSGIDKFNGDVGK